MKIKNQGKNENRVMLSGIIAVKPLFDHDEKTKRDYVMFALDQEEQIDITHIRIRSFVIATSEQKIIAKMKKLESFGKQAFVVVYGRLGVASKMNKRGKNALKIRIVPSVVNIITITNNLFYERKDKTNENKVRRNTKQKEHSDTL